MLPPIDLSYIASQLDELGEEIQRAYEESPAPIEPAPQVVLLGLDHLLDRLRETEHEMTKESTQTLGIESGSPPSQLLAHGLDLLDQLSSIATRLRLSAQAQAVGQLTLPLACWMVRRGAELVRPELVVNAAAVLANGLSHPEELAECCALISELCEGIPLERIDETESQNPARPWRLLLLNRAIVATRSQQPTLMVESFEAIVEHLPEDAPEFFREGMGQMETLNYPPQARNLMQRYYERWCSGQRLH